MRAGPVVLSFAYSLFDDDAGEAVDKVGRGWRNPEIVTGRFGGFLDDEDGSDEAAEVGSGVGSPGGSYVRTCEHKHRKKRMFRGGL